MSIFRRQNVSCPSCGTIVAFQAAHSINADRRADLRQAILDETFQTQVCPSCDASFRLDPLITYVDLGRNQWIAAYPLNRLGDWQAIEAECAEIFATSYGDQAPDSVRQLCGAITPRLVFGWAALREKLVVDEAGLDDAVLELVKIALLRTVGRFPVGRGVELRLRFVEEETLGLSWVKAGTGEPIERLRVPRALYREIAGEQMAWRSLHHRVASSLFVDKQRLQFREAA